MVWFMVWFTLWFMVWFTLLRRFIICRVRVINFWNELHQRVNVNDIRYGQTRTTGSASTLQISGRFDNSAREHPGILCFAIAIPTAESPSNGALPIRKVFSAFQCFSAHTILHRLSLGDKNQSLSLCLIEPASGALDEAQRLIAFVLFLGSHD
jgi:hypothetical protein